MASLNALRWPLSQASGCADAASLAQRTPFSSAFCRAKWSGERTLTLIVCAVLRIAMGYRSSCALMAMSVDHAVSIGLGRLLHSVEARHQAVARLGSMIQLFVYRYRRDHVLCLHATCCMHGSSGFGNIDSCIEKAVRWKRTPSGGKQGHVVACQMWAHRGLAGRVLDFRTQAFFR